MAYGLFQIHLHPRTSPPCQRQLLAQTKEPESLNVWLEPRPRLVSLMSDPLPSRTPAPPLGVDAQNAATDEGSSGRKHKTTACEECKKKKLKVRLYFFVILFAFRRLARVNPAGPFSVGATRHVSTASPTTSNAA